MAKRIITLDQLNGGASHDPKLGVKNGFKRSRSIDVRRRASSIVLQKRTVKESGSTVTTPVTDMIRVPDKSLYMMGDTKIYRRTAETPGGLGTYSTINISGATNVKSGVYSIEKDRVIIPGDTTIHWINAPATGSPSFVKDAITQILDKDVTNTGSATYSIPTSAINTRDTATADRFTWNPELEPLIKSQFYLQTKGTADLYWELHDATNAVLASGTILNASLPSSGSLFTITTSAIRQYIGANGTGRAYHFHFQGTGTTTTANQVRVATANDLSTADAHTYAAPLIGGVYHPCTQFLQFIVIGNERYVEVWEPITDNPLKTEFKPHRLTLPSGYKVLGFATQDENLVVSCVTSVNTDYGGDFGVNATEGYLLFWDGAQLQANWIKKSNAGAFECPQEKDGIVYGLINGILHATTGDVPVQVFTVPGVDNFTSSNGHDDDVYLQAPYKGMAIDRGVLMFGFPMVSANDSLTPGVYGFGTRNKDYPESFTLDHIPSHGDTTIGYDTSSPKIPLSGITFCGNFGANMFVAWSRGNGGFVTYGVDVIRRNNAPYAYGDLDSLDFDFDMPQKEKEADEIGIVYKTLPAGTTVTPRYRINDETNYQYGTPDQVQIDTDLSLTRLKVPKRFRRIEIGMELTGNTNGSPEVLDLYLIFDDLANEEQ